MNTLLEKFLRYNREYHMFQPSNRIGLAVSGGLDSMVMLDLFAQIQKDWQIELIILHYNHQLRGDESEGDETFVQQAAKVKGLEMICERGSVRTFAKAQKLSLETAARHLRYNFFTQAAQQAALDLIALAHQANDQAETVLSHIIRGAGLAGIRGIPRKRGIYIRPLLFAPRQEIQDYAQFHHVSYREDSTNSEIDFRRNRIRHCLLPMIEQDFNPRIIEALTRLAQAAEETECLLQHPIDDAMTRAVKEVGDDKIVLDIQQFLAYFNSLQRLVLQRVIGKLGANPHVLSFHRWRNLSQVINNHLSGSSFQLSPEIEVMIAGNDLAISKRSTPLLPVIIDADHAETPLWDNLFLEIKQATKPLVFAEKSRMEEFVDAEMLTPPLCVRTIQTGDFFWPINGRGRKKISDYLIDAKIPLYRRSRIPVLTCGRGIVWLCGLRLDERFKVTENTKKIYKLSLKTL